MPANMNWSARISTEAAYRRASGRRAINVKRKDEVTKRRRRVRGLVQELWAKSTPESKYQGLIAQRLGVSRATICRDFLAIRQEIAGLGQCPICHQQRPLPEIH